MRKRRRRKLIYKAIGILELIAGAIGVFVLTLFNLDLSPVELLIGNWELYLVFVVWIISGVFLLRTK